MLFVVCLLFVVVWCVLLVVCGSLFVDVCYLALCGVVVVY